MTSLYEMLLTMNNKSRKVVQRQPIASVQERLIIGVLNENLGVELETKQVGQLCGLKRDTTLKILERLQMFYDISSRLTYKPSSKTQVRRWTCHSKIVPRKEMK